MAKNKQSFIWVAIILNVLTVAMELAWILIYKDRLKLEMLTMFTNLSNLVCAVSCILYVVYASRKIDKGKEIPAWVVTFRFLSTVCMVMTSLTVGLILSFMESPFPEGHIRLMFSGYLLFVQTICPLLSSVSFLFFEKDTFPFKWKTVLKGMIPVVGYALMSVLMNLLRLWDGPYPFLKVYDQPIWMSFAWLLILMGAGFVFSLGLTWIKSIACRKTGAG